MTDTIEKEKTAKDTGVTSVKLQADILERLLEWEKEDSSFFMCYPNNKERAFRALSYEVERIILTASKAQDKKIAELKRNKEDWCKDCEYTDKLNGKIRELESLTLTKDDARGIIEKINEGLEKNEESAKYMLERGLADENVRDFLIDLFAKKGVDLKGKEREVE